MGPRPSKRNVDWDGDGMSEEQRYDRPTRYIVATSTPELKRGEQSLDDANRHHDSGPGFRLGVDRTDRASYQPRYHPYHCQRD